MYIFLASVSLISAATCRRNNGNTASNTQVNIKFQKKHWLIFAVFFPVKSNSGITLGQYGLKSDKQWAKSYGTKVNHG
jgi:hypothetical protein